MNLLALDTSTPMAALTLERSAEQRVSMVLGRERRHGRDLIPAIRDLLRNHSLSVNDLQVIGVGLGPGSYTGLRVGLTAAKCLAYATDAKLVGLDTLEWYARSAPEDALRVLSVADAQRGDLHVAEFVRSSPGALLRRVGPTHVIATQEFLSSLTELVVVVGPGLDAIRDSVRTPTSQQRGATPPPDLLLDLARDAVNSGREDEPWTLEPVYIRRSAAEDLWDRLPRSAQPAEQDLR